MEAWLNCTCAAKRAGGSKVYIAAGRQGSTASFHGLMIMEGNIVVDSSKVQYGPTHIESTYAYQTASVLRGKGGRVTVRPITRELEFRTERRVPKVGLMMVGWGGNNGSTVTGTILANKLQLQWKTKTGMQASRDHLPFRSAIKCASSLDYSLNTRRGKHSSCREAVSAGINRSN